MPAEGGEETLVAEGAQLRAWTVMEGGIYFIRFPAEGDIKARPQLVYLDTSTGRERQVVAFDKEPFPVAVAANGSLSVSPDGRRALFTTLQNVDVADIILVDNFR